MNVEALVRGAQEAIGVRRVFGEAYDKEGVTIIPVAYVAGGGGGGSGSSGPPPAPEEAGAPASARGSGGGMGFGLGAWPAGVYVIQHGRVRWRPAVNVNLIIIVGGVVALAAFRALRGRRPRRWGRQRH